jgi:glucose/arabinose dehydrogenase
MNYEGEQGPSNRRTAVLTPSSTPFLDFSAISRIVVLMRFPLLRLALFVPALCLTAPETEGGTLTRVPNTTLAMPPAPPVYGYSVTNAFGNLTVTNPVAIVAPPGETNRLFIVEQAGYVVVITNLAAPTRSVFLNVTNKILGGVAPDERGLLGLAFHPGYATNGLFFIYYTGSDTTAQGTNNSLHDILSRYRVSVSDSNQADPNSEVKLISQFDPANNHNAGDIHFGPDGYLYLSLADGGGSNDQFNNSEEIDQDFFSAIARLDVDKRPGSLAPNPHPSITTNYTIPPDNPFIGANSFNGSSVIPTEVRTEFWAVGLRNPWRFYFDPVTGFCYCADVGQDAYEELDIITKGGNYGWAYREGLHPGPKTPPIGFTSIDPIQEYAHGTATNQGHCIVGGVVYHGDRIAQLNGAYVFADYVDNNLWYLRYDGTNTVPYQWIGHESSISAFGIDPRNGDVLLASQSLNTIRRLVYSTNFTGPAIPATLAATGAFSNLTNLTPQAGIVPYDLNVPFWSDNAIKTRWFSVPNTNLTIAYNAAGNWSFPTGTVWIKHFELELTNGVASSRQRIETRLLVKNSTGMYGVTYRWGGSVTDATLVSPAGLDENFVIDDGGGVIRTQAWHYPSWGECQSCHTSAGGFALGFNTPQLNRSFDYGTGPTNQIGALGDAHYFTTNATGLHLLPSLVAGTNASVSAEYRIRSYLAANCVQCHQPAGNAQALWDARISTPTELAGLINGPLLNNGGDTNNHVITPGSLAHSTMYNRLANLGSAHMPPLDTTLVNTQAVALLAYWITNDLPAYQSFADWQLSYFGSTNASQAADTADPDGDHSVNYLEYLTATDPTNGSSNWKISMRHGPNGPQLVYPLIANRGFEVQATPNLLANRSWAPLDVSGNEPFFSATNGLGVFTDPSASPTQRLYRIRVYAP